MKIEKSGILISKDRKSLKSKEVPDMKVTVDPDLCISCGLCVSIDPNVFRFNEYDKSESYGEVTSENESSVQVAVDSCPVDAIQWVEK